MSEYRDALAATLRAIRSARDTLRLQAAAVGDRPEAASLTYYADGLDARARAMRDANRGTPQMTVFLR